MQVSEAREFFAVQQNSRSGALRRAPAFLQILAALLLSAIPPTVVSLILFSAQIEEPWNIVVASQVLSSARITFVVALAHAFLLGLPLFMFLRAVRRVGVLSCVAGGFLVAAIPAAVFGLSGMLGLQSASTGGVATVINGMPTLAGWMEYATGVGVMGLYGALGGLTFWLAIMPARRLVGVDDRPDMPSRGVDFASWGLGSLSVLLTSAVILLPVAVKDNSCHNLFRDGRNGIGPQLFAQIQLNDEEWNDLAQILGDFGRAHSLSLRHDEQIHNGMLLWRDVNLCNEAGLNIDALDRPGLAQLGSPPPELQGVMFSVYELKQGTDWAAASRELMELLQARWPDKLTFRGTDGKAISLEEALKGRE